MDGRRFGVGLAAGLLVGLAVVTAGGALGVVPGLTFLAPKSISGSFPAAATVSTTTASSSAVTTVTAVASSTSSISSATRVSIPQNSTAGNYTFAATTTSSTIFSTSSSTTPSLTNVVGTLTSSVPGPSYSSRVNSIAQQPLLSNTVILVPVLVAFLLGVLLYRVSVRGREEPSP